MLEKAAGMKVIEKIESITQIDEVRNPSYEIKQTARCYIRPDSSLEVVTGKQSALAARQATN